jgi:CRISPR-associated endonuclease/helicase Cas3
MAALAFVEDLLRLLSPEPLPRSLGRDAALPWRLAGLTTLADWIGSSVRHFPYVLVDHFPGLATYWTETARPAACRAVHAAGVSPQASAPFRGGMGLFPALAQLTPLQRWAETVVLPDGPMLAILEDITGSGKTEAAMILAHRLMAQGKANGIFIGLPTMATANGMYRRMAKSYRLLFADPGAPSLVLAHGRAALDAGFTCSILPDAADDTAPQTLDAAAEPAGAQCAAWLADDRRKAMLAQVGVGTIDQALLSVLPVRHAALRLYGLTGKVLIIDEAHAFDPYMGEEVVRLLQFHAALGGSAILLSATLPMAIRRKMVATWQAGLGAAPCQISSSAYPLATLVGLGGAREDPIAPREGSARRVTVTRLSGLGEALERIGAASAAGAAVAWVRNTVDDAIGGWSALREAGIEAILFHARFAMVDRLRIESMVLDRFGPTGQPAQRRGVVVATQVMEQSLDLDFDLMVTDLAPVDLLIQRAGRLWRHDRGATRALVRPELLVLAPEPVADPPSDWLAEHPGTAAVYRDPSLLWRSARALFSAGEIVAPEGLRSLIEAAADGESPEGLRVAADRAAGMRLSQAAVAKQNLLDLAKGYARHVGLWAPEEHTPTRLEDRPQVTLRLARLRDGVVIPYAEEADEHRAWALSEVVVAEHRAKALSVPPNLAAAVAAARARWPRWERESARIRLVPMERNSDGKWCFPAAGDCRYRPNVGLLLSEAGETA